jgi:hypothetical protein
VVRLYEGIPGGPGANGHQACAMVRDPVQSKWFRNLAISEILADTLEDMDLKLPPAEVDIAEIRRKYHDAVAR